MLRLECEYLPDAATGRFRMTLRNDGSKPVDVATLAYSAMVRLKPDAEVAGGRFLGRFGNHHSIVPDEGLLSPGQALKLDLSGLTHVPRHVTDGPKSAYVRDRAGKNHPVAVAPTTHPDAQSAALQEVPRPGPISLVPWPSRVTVSDLGPPPAALRVSSEVTVVADLCARLFPLDPPVFAEDGVAITLTDGPASGYDITFEGGSIELSAGSDAGRMAGLITLAQLMRHARIGGAFPREGRISDRPRFDWRGVHFDVVRHMRPTSDVLRFLDIMAWLKLNRFHWHLTDDEGWRLDIPALPELARVGGWRGPDLPMLPQHGYGAERHGGVYFATDVRTILDRAAALSIDVIPEIDTPGHSTAAMTAYPHLRDPEEAPNSYRAVQGYPNPALNPGLPETWAFVETVLDHVTTTFTGRHIHIGGDEVPAEAWARSPAAQHLAAREGISGAMGLHSWFLRKAQAMIAARGRVTVAWDEAAEGEGIGRDAILMGWRDRDQVPDLLAKGYRVIATPGSACYLDQAEDAAWETPGLAWAGNVSPQRSYAYDPADGVDGADMPRLLGVAACIWCENMADPGVFNRMVFPRLAAIAEVGWTPVAVKNYDRWRAAAEAVPKLY